MAFRLVQLSDPHLGATWTELDPSERLQQTLAAVAALRPRPDALLVTGDLADHGAEAEYAELHDALMALGIPFHVLGGNHDDRGRLRAAFDVPGDGAGPVEYAIDLGPARLVVLDTTIPGARRR